MEGELGFEPKQPDLTDCDTMTLCQTPLFSRKRTGPGFRIHNASVVFASFSLLAFGKVTLFPF